MPGPRFRSDDKPVFNEFGKPIIQVHAENDPTNCYCCAKCEQYLQCYKRAPLLVDFNGIDFSGWIEWAQLVWDTTWTRSRQGNFTGSDPDGSSEFIGKFLFLPYDTRLPCDGQPCRDDDLEASPSGLGCLPLCGTHFSPYYRTINTPSNPEWLNKNVVLRAFVECCHEDDNPELESIGVRFGISLVIETEYGTWGWGFSGGYWSWRHIGAWAYGDQCCPIAYTDCIPWAELDPNDWSNLQDLPLSTNNRLWYNDEVAEEPDIVGCNFYHWNWFGCEHACDTFDEINEECDVCEDCPDPYEGCSNGAAAIGVTVGFTCGGLETEIPVCIPDPMRLLDYASNTLSVLGGNCRQKDCENCEPVAPMEGEPKPPARTVNVSFEVSGGGDELGDGCGKTFTAIYPDCLDVEEENIFWSFGKVGPTAYHYLNNLVGNSATDYGEIVTLMIIDNRGCVYTYCQLVTCECCVGVGGSLSVSIPEDGCDVEVTATLTGECEGFTAQPFIEIQFFSGLAPAGKDCHCDSELEEDEFCTSNKIALTDGQSLTWPGLFKGLRWRVWDRPCGCAGPWTEVPHEADCPVATVYLDNVLAETLDYDENCGFATLEDFTWTVDWPAFLCGERLSIAWHHTGYTEGCAEGTILNPGDPEEDQIARHVFEETVLRGRGSHTIKFWLVGDGFICPSYCTGFPECSYLNPDYNATEECEAIGYPVCATE